MSEASDKVWTTQQTLEELGRINEEFIGAATELYEAVKDVDAGGVFNETPGVSYRVQKAVNSIDAPTEELLSFLGRANVVDVPDTPFYCPECGAQVWLKKGDPDKDEPAYFGDCAECGRQWDIEEAEPDDAGVPEKTGSVPGDAGHEDGGYSGQGEEPPGPKIEQAPEIPPDEI